MSVLMALGWVMVGCARTGVFLRFWDEIREWLNHTAADIVQKYIGYDARQAMQRAVCRVDRVVDRIRQMPTVYYKRNRLDTHFDKVTYEATAPVYEFDRKILNEIEQKGQLVQEMEYRR